MQSFVKNCCREFCMSWILIRENFEGVINVTTKEIRKEYLCYQFKRWQSFY